MGRPETIPPLASPAAARAIVVPEPPEQITRAVATRLTWCRRELERLQALRPAMAVASSQGKPRADERLATLGRKIQAVEFEIACNVKAAAHASMIDCTALAAFRARLQELPVEKLIEGLGRELCCGLCGPEAGCVISGGDPTVGDGCAHPIREGGPPPQCKNHPRVQAVYRAACAKLKVKPLEWR